VVGWRWYHSILVLDNFSRFALVRDGKLDEMGRDFIPRAAKDSRDLWRRTGQVGVIPSSFLGRTVASEHYCSDH
jgi:hypothetical protein